MANKVYLKILWLHETNQKNSRTQKQSHSNTNPKHKKKKAYKNFLNKSTFQFKRIVILFISIDYH